MSAVNFKVEGDAEVAAEMKRLIRKMEDTEPFLKNVGEIIHNSTMDRFKREEDPEGQPWKPLAPITIRQRLQKKGNAQITILRVEGDLKSSFHYQIRSSVLGKKLIYGSGLDYAAIHDQGGMAGRNRQVKIPARTILGITAQDKDDIFAEGADWIEREN